MYLIRPPSILRKLFPGLIWTIPNDENRVFLTFDDGPDPEVTPWVLDMLGKYDAKATFFCLGRNVEKYPDLFERIKAEGHAVGNHSYSHPDGWRTKNSDYFEDIGRADSLIGSRLFRPPYGRITPFQIKELKKKYRIVMWDLLSGDFISKTTAQKCLQNSARAKEPGSILVLHDKARIREKLHVILPIILNDYLNSELETGIISSIN
jgi:peptidoglycan/xylan/chitin deacetylase (PgdA/CDA1 family)